MKTKVCTKCGKRKPLGEYHGMTASNDGKRPDCKKCNCARVRAWCRANPERKAAWQLRNREWCNAYEQLRRIGGF